MPFPVVSSSLSHLPQETHGARWLNYTFVVSTLNTLMETEVKPRLLGETVDISLWVKASHLITKVYEPVTGLIINQLAT